jgi:hypothetical protein
MATITQEQIAAACREWDEYVESMGSVMGEVERMAQEMRIMLGQLAAQHDCDPDGCYAHIKALADRAEGARTYEDGLMDAAQVADDWFYNTETDEITDRLLGNSIRALLPEEKS